MINETERTPEVFREHFEECLRHFANRFNAKYPPRSKGLSEAMIPILDFCGVGFQTARRWLSKERFSMPNGLTNAKLRCFLDLNGYRIIEFERLPIVLRNLSELLGYSVISPDEASSIIGYSRAQNIYPVLREDEDWGLGEQKKARMFDLWKERRNDLERKKKEALKLYRFNFLAPTESRPLLLSSPPANGAVATRRAAVFTILEGVLALVDEGLFDELSENELAALKQSDGGTILQLSARLTALSSKLMAAEGRR